MKTDFKVYKHKIHVYRVSNILDGKNSSKWVYVWSTNAFRTCKDAVANAESLHPGVRFIASFEKN